MSEPEFRIFALKLAHYQLHGWHIYDLYYSRRCQCCGESGLHAWKNIDNASLQAERAKFLESSDGSVDKCFDVEAGSLDSFIRFQDDRLGAYAPDGAFVPWPVSAMELTDSLVEWRDTMTRRQSQTQKLAMWFVSEILHSYDESRVWQTTDFSGPIMKQSADLLKRYDADTIAGCLEANRDGLIGDGFDLTFISGIEKSGEPPLIQQWFDYIASPPPIYMEYNMQQWSERRDKHYPMLEPDPVDPNQPVKLPRKKKPRKKTMMQIAFGE